MSEVFQKMMTNGWSGWFRIGILLFGLGMAWQDMSGKLDLINYRITRLEVSVEANVSKIDLIRFAKENRDDYEKKRKY
jgi:hypothetical protein